MKLKHKNVLITGANRGIGLAIAKELNNHGANILAGVRNPDGASQLKKDIPNVSVIRLDVTDTASVDSAIEVMKSSKTKLDVLINNAGVMYEQDYMNLTSSDQIHMEIDTNFKAPAILIQKAMELLRGENEAAVINISSGVGILPIPRYPIYSATKAAMHSFSKSLRYQLRNTNIKVIEVLPPIVDTEMIDVLSSEGKKEKRMSPNQFASELIQEIEKGKTTIPLGASKSLMMFHRIIPSIIQKSLNKY